MKKIDEWHVEAQGPIFDFHVKFYQDIKSGDFVAKIELLSREVPEGDSLWEPTSEELRNKDLNQLCKKTELLITERGGKILSKRISQ